MTRFTPFHIIHEVDYVLPIECQIPSLYISIKVIPKSSILVQFLITLKQVDKDYIMEIQTIQATKKHSKSHSNTYVHPHKFQYGNLVHVYDQANDNIRK